MIGNRLTLFLGLWLTAFAAVAADPAPPPLGLKTYRDLGLMVDETMLARVWHDGGSDSGRLQKTLVQGGWVFPLFDQGHQIKLTRTDPQTLWSSYSKNDGQTWSEPRFVAAFVEEATVKSLEFRRASGKTLRFTLENFAGRKCDLWFREDDLCRLATAEDLRRAPAGRFVITSVLPDAPPMVFTRSDQKTLIALHHNRAVLRSVHEPVHSEWLNMPSPTAAEIALRNEHRTSVKDWVSRAEVWFSLSKDNEQTWSEPRLLFANALAETLEASNPNYQCSYVDLFLDKGLVHLIVPHRWNRVVHLSFPEAQLGSFLTRDELRQALQR